MSNVENGFRVDVDWPDHKGMVGFQPASHPPEVSYMPSIGGASKRPRVGEVRSIGNQRFKILAVFLDIATNGIITLELEPVK